MLSYGKGTPDEALAVFAQGRGSVLASNVTEPIHECEICGYKRAQEVMRMLANLPQESWPLLAIPI